MEPYENIPDINKLIQICMREVEDGRFMGVRSSFQFGEIVLPHGEFLSGSSNEVDWVNIFIRDLIASLTEKYPYSGFEVIRNEIFPESILQNGRSYVLNSFLCSMVRYFELYRLFPQIEQLVKACFVSLIKELVSVRCFESSILLPQIKRNFKEGRTIKEITSLPPYAYNHPIFKECTSISQWNEYRIIVQKYAASKETFDLMFGDRLFNLFRTPTDIKKFKSLLNSGNFTPETLLNYIDRVDTYQAIPPDEAIDILGDYLQMCRRMDVPPRLDSNSLKREHDVMSRNMRAIRQEEDEEKFYQVMSRHQDLAYGKGEYVIVLPQTAKDIIDEGIQQRHCVGSYARSVCEGRSIIVFMRRKSSPNTPLITIALNNDYNVTQALMACNRPVTNPSMHKFLEEWKQYIQQLRWDIAV